MNPELRKSETAVATGLERRPARASAARVVDGCIQRVRQTIDAEHAAAMDAALQGGRRP